MTGPGCKIKQWLFAGLVLFCSTGFLVFVSACDRPAEPIKIGFIASLTERTGDVGLAARNGALLAIEQINSSGGLKGAPVELLVRDIGNDPAKARTAMEELSGQGVYVSVGPVLSSMAVVLAPLAEAAGHLLVSPTVSTNMLGEKDDYFLRIYPQCRETATLLAGHVYRKQHRRMAIIIDQSNRAFTEDWRDVFKEKFKQQGGEVVRSISYLSGSDQGFLELTSRALESNADGLLIIGSAIDAAMIVQQLDKISNKVPVYVSEWSFTRDFLTHGGRAVEGASLFHTFNEQSQTPKYLKFVENFKQRFGSVPSFPAVHAYDSTTLVLAGLQQGARSGEKLKHQILHLGKFETLQSSIKLNRFGDVTRDLYLTEVRNGGFVVVGDPFQAVHPGE